MVNRSQRVEALLAIGSSLAANFAWAQQSPGATSPDGGVQRPAAAPRSSQREFQAQPLSLAQDAPTSQKAPSEKEHAKAHSESSGGNYTGPYHYREISDFFNIREAYANVHAGEWEFETEFEWETSSGESDRYGPAFSLKYGITDTFFAELEVLPITLGHGGEHGNGDVALILFNEFWKESEWVPAFGAWLEGRFPTGEGSSGVDGELHFNFTKQVATNCRAHFEGFVMTANGSRGGDDADRRDFQWGAGPGFDYSFSDDTIVAVNYLNRVSDEVGDHNENVVEFGVAQRIAPNQHLKFAVDVGVDGQESTPNVGAKILWSIEW